MCARGERRRRRPCAGCTVCVRLLAACGASNAAGAALHAFTSGAGHGRGRRTAGGGKAGKGAKGGEADTAGPPRQASSRPAQHVRHLHGVQSETDSDRQRQKATDSDRQDAERTRRAACERLTYTQRVCTCMDLRAHTHMHAHRMAHRRACLVKCSAGCEPCTWG